MADKSSVVYIAASNNAKPQATSDDGIGKAHSGAEGGKTVPHRTVGGVDRDGEGRKGQLIPRTALSWS